MLDDMCSHELASVASEAKSGRVPQGELHFLLSVEHQDRLLRVKRRRCPTIQPFLSAEPGFFNGVFFPGCMKHGDVSIEEDGVRMARTRPLMSPAHASVQIEVRREVVEYNCSAWSCKCCPCVTQGREVYHRNATGK